MKYLILTFMFFGMSLYADIVNDPFTPSVTKKELQIINVANAISITNATDAIKYIKKNIHHNSGPAINYTLGNLYFKTEQYDKAIACYNSAIKQLPKFRAALANLGRIYIIKDNKEKALEQFRKLVKDGQADSNIFLLMGHTFILLNKPYSAEVAYRQSLLLDPDNNQAMLGLAKSLIIQDRKKEALALLKEILSNNPQDSSIWSLVTNTQVALEKYTDAIVTIETAIKLHKESPELLALLGELYLNKEQPDDAIKAFSMAFKTGKLSNQQIIKDAKALVDLKEFKKANKVLTFVKEDIITQKDNLDYLITKAVILENTEQLNDAKKILSNIIKQYPLCANALISLGDIYKKENKLENALIMYERAARIKGFESIALIKQARIEIEKEHLTKALSLLKESQKFNKKSYISKYIKQLEDLIE